MSDGGIAPLSAHNLLRHDPTREGYCLWTVKDQR